jgi:hypothetical protein
VVMYSCTGPFLVIHNMFMVSSVFPYVYLLSTMCWEYFDINVWVFMALIFFFVSSLSINVMLSHPDIVLLKINQVR